MDSSQQSAVKRRRDGDDSGCRWALMRDADCRSAVVDDAMETPSHSKTMAVNMAAETNQTKEDQLEARNINKTIQYQITLYKTVL